LKPSADTKEIVQKLGQIYGNVKTSDRIAQDFYSATQKENEHCSAWAVRVETLFQRAVDEGEMDDRKRDTKLKERFWRGLKSEKLKSASRVSYESLDSFETLRRKVRMEEEECKVGIETKVAVSSQQQADVLKELLERMKSLETEMSRIKEEKRTVSSRYDSGGFRRERRPYRGSFSNRRGGNFDYRRREISTNNTTTPKETLNTETLPSQGLVEAKKK
jgi:hypothetical protein